MARLHKAGDIWRRSFTTTSSAGAAANADATPTGTIYLNGTANAATVTVTSPATGVYHASATLPGAAGDAIDVVIAATIGGVATKDVIDSFRLVGFDPEDAADLGLSNLDASVSSRSTYSGSGGSGTYTYPDPYANPNATVPGGKYTVNGVLVNCLGQPIDADGNVL